MTKEELIAAGVDYEGGLAICMNKEDFYFRLIIKSLENEKFISLKQNLEQNDLNAAFEDAHALKGVAGNLHLTNLYSAIEQIVEPLRAGDSTKDYNALYENIFTELRKLKKIAGIE